MLNHLRKIDWVLTLYAALLVLFGLISIFSIGAGDDFLHFKKQLIWFILGVAVMILISLFDYRILKNQKMPIVFIFIASCLLLVGLFKLGAEIRGAANWYKVGPIAFEPVEVVKITLIILLAKYFSLRHVEIHRFRHILVSGFYVLAPSLILFLQSEIGSVAVILGTWLGVMVLAGIRLKHLFALGVTALAVSVLMWSFVLHDYQRSRIVSFISPSVDPQGAGYNVLQSLIAVGSGGFWGRGLGEGTQIQLGFLPEARTDFIFAGIFEEVGLVGATLLLLCFCLLIRRIMQISRKSENNFARLVSAGFSIMLLSQIFVNISMTLGLFPVTGIPLPFVSYGGSSLLSLFAMLGLLQSIKINQTER